MRWGLWTETWAASNSVSEQRNEAQTDTKTRERRDRIGREFVQSQKKVCRGTEGYMFFLCLPSELEKHILRCWCLPICLGALSIFKCFFKIPFQSHFAAARWVREGVNDTEWMSVPSVTWKTSEAALAPWQRSGGREQYYTIYGDIEFLWLPFIILQVQ